MVIMIVITWKIFQVRPHPSGNMSYGHEINALALNLLFHFEDSIRMDYFNIIRLAGHHEYGWRGDTINLYQGEFYNGLEVFAYDDNEKLHYDNFGR